jgi:hypothetical protein
MGEEKKGEKKQSLYFIVGFVFWGFLNKYSRRFFSSSIFLTRHLGKNPQNLQ